MRIRLAFALFASMLALLPGASPVAGQPKEANVAKLIDQLGASDFRTRDQASSELEKLGESILPTLRKAAATPNIALETKRRIENVAARIESNLLNSEEKSWQALDAPRRDVRERLLKIIARTPTLSDRQVVAAVYFMSTGRPPTDAEAAQGIKQLGERNHRHIPTLQLARSLVQGNEFNADLAAANGRILKIHKQLPGDLAQQLAFLNSSETQKVTDAAAAAIDKSAKTDEHFGDLAYLLVLSRFPDANQSAQVVNHIKKKKNRSIAGSDIIWALINTKEFVMAP